MRQLLFPLAFTFFAAAACIVALVESGIAQEVAAGATSQTGVVLTKLSPPVYPPLARQARISGDVKLILTIHRDGNVASAAVISGPPMLSAHAMQSAQESQFECRGCQSESSYSLTYTFRVEGNLNPCCCTNKPGAAEESQDWRREPQVTQSEGHVTIIAGPVCICPDECELKWAQAHAKARSAKCLYLWRCAARQVSIQ